LHKARKGTPVIIATFGWMTDDEARRWEPTLVFVDARNRATGSTTNSQGRVTLAARGIDRTPFLDFSPSG
jgi:aspartate 1-decarboxylase